MPPNSGAFNNTGFNKLSIGSQLYLQAQLFYLM